MRIGLIVPLIAACAPEPESLEFGLGTERSGTSFEQQRLTPSDADQEWFGNTPGSISISGDTLMIGAPVKDDSTGAAYVFERVGDTFSEVQKLLPMTRQMVEKFGDALSVSGDRALIGAHQRDAARGAVFSFIRSGTTWEERQILQASDGVADDHFGMSVWMSGDAALIAAPFTRGLVYTFGWDGSAWVEQGKLMASDGGPLGGCISGSGDTVAVCGDNAVHVFVRSAGVWSEQQKVVPTDGIFTGPASVFGDRLLVGSGLENTTGDASGAAYLFVRSAGTWSFDRKIVPVDGHVYAAFGQSVALLEHDAIIGSPGWNQLRGTAYVYSVDTPGRVGKLPVSDSELGGVGRAVAGTDEFMFVGGSSGDVWAVYAFRNVKRSGVDCTENRECETGFCANGVCCTTACDGACSGCSYESGSGTNGDCAVMPAGSRGDPDCGTLTCDGVSDDCVPCTTDALCPSDRYCASDNTCQIRKPVGSTCNFGAGADCAVRGCRVCMGSDCLNGTCSSPSYASTPGRRESGCGCRTVTERGEGKRSLALLLLCVAARAFRRRRVAFA